MTLTISNPVTELEALQHALEASARLVHEGNMIDLKGLDEQVEILCGEIVKTEGPLRLELLPRLEEIIQVLDQLEAGLRQQSPVAGQEAQNRLRARDAYGQGNPPGFFERMGKS